MHTHLLYQFHYYITNTAMHGCSRVREQDVGAELRKWRELPRDSPLRIFAYIDGVRLLAKVENTIRAEQRSTGVNSFICGVTYLPMLREIHIMQSFHSLFTEPLKLTNSCVHALTHTTHCSSVGVTSSTSAASPTEPSADGEAAPLPVPTAEERRKEQADIRRQLEKAVHGRAIDAVPRFIRICHREGITVRMSATEAVSRTGIATCRVDLTNLSVY